MKQINNVSFGSANMKIPKVKHNDLTKLVLDKQKVGVNMEVDLRSADLTKIKKTSEARNNDLTKLVLDKQKVGVNMEVDLRSADLTKLVLYNKKGGKYETK